MRVVSLVPSLTETLLAWGITPVAVTRFCEQPDLPAVGGTKDPDVAAIARLAPDLVLVDEEENRREDAEALQAAGLRLHVTAVRALDEVAPALAALAHALGLAEVPVAAGERGAAADAGETEGGGWHGRPPGARPSRVFVPIWRRPWMTVSRHTYAATVLDALGIATLFADRAERYPEVTLEEVVAADPDAVLLPTEPYPFRDRHAAALAAELGRPVRLVDGQDLFWWGARTPAALVRLARSLS